MKTYCTWVLTSTSVCCVHSNVYDLGNIHRSWYLTAVDPFHSTSSAIQTYYWLTSVSVEIPLATFGRNSSSIGEKPVTSCWSHSTIIRRHTTCSLIGHAEQGSIIVITNVLQSHDTVVLVHCTIEWEPDITCTWECLMYSFAYVTSKNLYSHTYELPKHMDSQNKIHTTLKIC